MDRNNSVKSIRDHWSVIVFAERGMRSTPFGNNWEISREKLVLLSLHYFLPNS